MSIQSNNNNGNNIAQCEGSVFELDMMWMTSLYFYIVPLSDVVSCTQHPMTKHSWTRFSIFSVILEMKRVESLTNMPVLLSRSHCYVLSASKNYRFCTKLQFWKETFARLYLMMLQALLSTYMLLTFCYREFVCLVETTPPIRILLWLQVQAMLWTNKRVLLEYKFMLRIQRSNRHHRCHFLLLATFPQRAIALQNQVD